mgnify:FL=1
MTLETQYKNYKIRNPESTLTFDEWKEFFGKQLEKGIKEIEFQGFINKNENTWGCEVIKWVIDKDQITGVIVQSDNGDTQYMSMLEYENFLKNRGFSKN